MSSTKFFTNVIRNNGRGYLCVTVAAFEAFCSSQVTISLTLDSNIMNPTSLHKACTQAEELMPLKSTMLMFARLRSPGSSGYLYTDVLNRLEMSLHRKISSHLGWQQIPSQFLSFIIGMFAVSTLLVGAFFWRYISRKYKKDRQTSPACHCVDLKQSGGCHSRKSGGMLCDSVAHAAKSGSRQPRPSVTNSESAECELHVTCTEQCYAQMSAEARLATSSIEPSETVAIDETSMHASSGSTSPRYSSGLPTYGQHELDADYLEYEMQVRARARELENNNPASGDRHAWKSLLFWKRSTKETGSRAFVSAAPTPVHPSYRSTAYKPSTPGPTSAYAQRTPGPLYTDDFSTLAPQHWSNRPLSDLRSGGNAIRPRRDDCYMSPYVPLNRPRRFPSAPLYVV